MKRKEKTVYEGKPAWSRMLRAIKLVEIREKYNMTRGDLSRAGHISYQTIYKWEMGLRPVPEWAYTFYDLLGEHYGMVQRAGDKTGTDTITSE